MSAIWLTIALVAVASAVLKAAGPLLLGDRQLGPRSTRVITLLAPALLTALVLVAPSPPGSSWCSTPAWPASPRPGSPCAPGAHAVVLAAAVLTTALLRQFAS